MATPVSASSSLSDLLPPSDNSQAQSSTATSTNKSDHAREEKADEVKPTELAQMRAMEMQGHNAREIAEALNLSEAEVEEALQLPASDTSASSAYPNTPIQFA